MKNTTLFLILTILISFQILHAKTNAQHINNIYNNKKYIWPDIVLPKEIPDYTLLFFPKHTKGDWHKPAIYKKNNSADTFLIKCYFVQKNKNKYIDKNQVLSTFIEEKEILKSSTYFLYKYPAIWSLEKSKNNKYVKLLFRYSDYFYEIQKSNTDNVYALKNIVDIAIKILTMKSSQAPFNYDKNNKTESHDILVTGEYILKNNIMSLRAMNYLMNNKQNILRIKINKNIKQQFRDLKIKNGNIISIFGEFKYKNLKVPNVIVKKIWREK